VRSPSSPLPLGPTRPRAPRYKGTRENGEILTVGNLGFCRELQKLPKVQERMKNERGAYRNRVLRYGEPWSQLAPEQDRFSKREHWRGDERCLLDMNIENDIENNGAIIGSLIN
jgi:hypothetical protein